MNLVYKIESASNINGSHKSVPKEWLDGEFLIKNMNIGTSATLIFCNHSEGNVLRTSKVIDIRVWDNLIILTTSNTIYYLQPLIK